MSLKSIEEELKRFIKSENKTDGPNGQQGEVIALKGKWGTGKTHFWREIIEKYNDKKYVYISLFGLENIEQIKTQLALETIKSFSENDLNLPKFVTDHLEAIGKTIGGISKKFFAPLPISSFSLNLIENTIICFDDLERKGEKLRLEDFFGLVSILKEQKNCKILIILNNQNINDDIYKEYREKIIDSEILFSPDIRDTSKYIFNEETSEHSFIRDKCHQYDLTNIRTYIKIKNCLAKLNAFFPPLHEDVRQTIIDSIIRMNAIHWENKSLPEDPRGDSLQGILKSFVENGYHDMVEMKEQLTSYNKLYLLDISNSAVSGKYMDIIHHASHSFKFTEADIAEEISDLCADHEIEPSQANFLLKIAHEDIKRPDLCKEILEAMRHDLTTIEETIENKEAFGESIATEILEERDKIKSEQNSDLVKDISAKIVLNTILDKIDRVSFLREEQLIQLNALTIDDIVNYYYQIDHINKDHRALLQKCLSSNYVHQTHKELHEKVRKKFSEALIQLIGDSEWNKKKIGWLGFDYDGLLSITKETK
jgi:hypothetical protein